MKWAQHKKKTIGGVAIALFIATGTYNAVVINSASLISSSENRFVKRLDEVYGVTKYGERQAASVKWEKLTPGEVAQVRSNPSFKISPHIPSQESYKEFNEAVTPAAAVQEVLSLNLNEVINSKKWPNGLPNTQFNGSLATNNGVIESLSVSLPNGEGISVSFSEMAGNVFEYDLDNEVYSGMLYQVDATSYMVTLSNGPLEGTRLRFVGEPSEEQRELIEHQVAETEIQQTGNVGEPDYAISDREAQQMTITPEPGSTAAIDYGNGADAPLYDAENVNPEVSQNNEYSEQDLQANSYNMENQQAI